MAFIYGTFLRYPVYPWVIKEYEASTLDLDDPKIYRDLSKPIGALNPKRLNEFKNRYNQMQPPKYLYGTHYSAPGYVIGYLVRRHPQYMLKLQVNTLRYIIYFYRVENLTNPIVCSQVSKKIGWF